MTYVLHVLHIIMSREQKVVYGDFWLIIVVIMATLIDSLLVVFILDKQFNWRLMDRFRSRERGRDIAHFITCVTLGFQICLDRIVCTFKH